MVDTKLTALTATTALDGTELLYVVEDPSGTPVSNKITAANARTYLNKATVRSVGITIDGGGAVITTGVKGYIEVPYSGTINQVTMLADISGSAVVDIWKAAYASYPPVDGNSITASAVPTITTSTKSQDTTLTGWTTSVTAGDILGFNVDSATTITRLQVLLKVTTS